MPLLFGVDVVPVGSAPITQAVTTSPPFAPRKIPSPKSPIARAVTELSPAVIARPVPVPNPDGLGPSSWIDGPDVNAYPGCDAPSIATGSVIVGRSLSTWMTWTPGPEM